MDMACQSIMTGYATAVCANSSLGLDGSKLDSNVLRLEQALVIGSNMMLSPETSVLMANMSFLSPGGLGFSFDERANG